MRRLWIIATLVCFSFTAFAVEQQVDKETYRKQAEKTLDEFKQKMEDLKVKAAVLKMDSKEKFDREMKVLKKKKAAADRKVAKLKTATAETWEKAKTDADKAMEELSMQYDRMMSRFRQPEP